MKKRVVTALYLGITLALLFLSITGHLSQWRGRQGLLLPNGDPLGGDFIAFYTGGALLGTDEAPHALYNFRTQLEFQQRLLSSHGPEPAPQPPFLPFIYPPIVAFLFLPVSLLPFPVAYACWLVVSILITLSSVELLLRANKSTVSWKERILTNLGFFAFTPLTIDCLAGGQVSVIGLLLLSLAYHQLARGRFWGVGLILGFSYYKAPLFALLILPLMRALPGRFVIGLLCAGTIIWGLELSLLGIEGWQTYGIQAYRYTTGDVDLLNFQEPAKLGVGVFGALQRADWLPPSLPPLVILCGLALSWLALLFFLPQFRSLFRWQRTHSLPKGHLQELGVAEPTLQVYLNLFIVALVGSLTFSLQVNNYDLSLLLIPLFHFFYTNQNHENTRLTPSFLLEVLVFLLLGYFTGLVNERALLPLTFILLNVQIFSHFFIAMINKNAQRKGH